MGEKERTVGRTRLHGAFVRC